MIEDVPTRIFVVTATISGALIVLSVLLAHRKPPWTAWVMASGAALATIGMAMAALVAFDLSEWLLHHGEYPCCGSICLGAMVFAVGFLMDQIRHRAIARHRQQLETMTTLPTSPSMERSNQNE